MHLNSVKKTELYISKFEENHQIGGSIFYIFRISYIYIINSPESDTEQM